MGMIGFLLSPLSWWNDLFVNVPLALLVAWPISLVWPAAFAASFVAAYWLTNVIGLVLLQKGARQAATGQATPLNRRELAKDLLIALGYTLLIVALVRWHVLQPLPDYFPGRR